MPHRIKPLPSVTPTHGVAPVALERGAPTETEPLLGFVQGKSNDLLAGHYCGYYGRRFSNFDPAEQRAWLIYTSVFVALLILIIVKWWRAVSELDACILESSPANAGYDAVAYFSLDPYPNGTAVLGSEEISSVYQGYTYYFSSDANQITFEDHPEKYLPLWGGFCAYGIASESWWTWDEVKEAGPSSNPNVWLIHNDKLHLFMLPDAMTAFEAEASDLDSTGNAKWTSWTGNTNDKPPENYHANTGCFWDDLHCGEGGFWNETTSGCDHKEGHAIWGQH